MSELFIMKYPSSKKEHANSITKNKNSHISLKITQHYLHITKAKKTNRIRLNKYCWESIWHLSRILRITGWRRALMCLTQEITFSSNWVNYLLDEEPIMMSLWILQWRPSCRTSNTHEEFHTSPCNEPCCTCCQQHWTTSSTTAVNVQPSKKQSIYWVT